MNSIHIKPILYMGRIIASKGIDMLIQAYYDLYKEYDCHTPLWIIGGNKEEIAAVREMPQVHDKAEELEAVNQLFWWGHIPHDVLPYLIGKCCFFCFPSLYEPGGRTILEAMACGLPVIANPYGFAEEVVKTGETGILIHENTPVVWKEAMKQLLHTPEKTEVLGQNARQLIATQYSMQIFQQKHWNIYSGYLRLQD